MNIKPGLFASLALSAVLISTASLFAQATQSPATTGLRFDVVSIKLSPTPPTMGYKMTPGRFSASGLHLGNLISLAYETANERIVLPEWIGPRVFSIEATMPPKTSQEQFREVLRALLEERFSLRVRRELREMPVLLLVRARRDGRLGPQLQAVQRDCSKPEAVCRERQTRGVLEVDGHSWETIRLASFVSGSLRSIVVDRTGLSGGQYDMTLRWQFDVAADLDPDRPATIAVALEEQLGLKLERARERVEMLVVDNVAMPSAN